MVTNFDFATSARICFGNGRVAELPTLAREWGRRPLFVTGSRLQRAQKVIAAVARNGDSPTIFSVSGEPDIALVERGAELARSARCDCVIALGGGSVMDAGKAIAALATNQRNVFEYLEVIGEGKPLTQTPLPVMAIPTTAGTGAEVTRNAVLHSAEHRVKVSLRHPLMLPRLALVDPELTHDLPPALTASTGMDALTQLIEPFVSKRANAVTDAICRSGLARAARSLRCVFQNGRDSDARGEMALASLFGGLALANAGLGAVHGFAAPIGGMYSAPHGAVCAALLPDVMEANIRIAQEQGATEIVSRYDEVARILLGSTSARASDGVTWARELCRDLEILQLAHFGIQRGEFAEIASKAAVSSSMKGNPVTLNQAQLVEILERSF
jgi:alcohol dehydrogenase class IV